MPSLLHPDDLVRAWADAHLSPGPTFTPLSDLWTDARARGAGAVGLGRNRFYGALRNLRFEICRHDRGQVIRATLSTDGPGFSFIAPPESDPDAAGDLYLVRVSSTRVKVGRTQDCARRVKEHRSVALAYGGYDDAAACYFPGAWNFEALSVRVLEQLSPAVAREFFDIPFEQAAALVEAVTQIPRVII